MDLTSQEVFDRLPIGGGPLLLAVSGGIDSMVMAHAILSVTSDVAVAHCNFHLRGEESDSDEKLVEQLCKRFSVKLFVEHFDTAAFASSHGVSIEMAARELRYRWFDSLCSAYGFSAVCVAHNANDNAETLVLNLLRGTGVKGLCGMGERSVNPYGNSLVVRPLLSFSRKRIEEYACRYNLEYHTDSTNLCTDYKRNRVRNQIFPLFAEINPSFLEVLSRDINNFAEASNVIDSYFNNLEDLGIRSVNGRVTLPLEKLQKEPHWKYALHLFLSNYGFNASVSHSLSKLLQKGSLVSGKKFFSADFRLITTTDSIIVEPLSQCGAVNFAVSEEDWIAGSDPRTGRGEIILDADKLPDGLTIRRWQPGDWLSPIGLKGRKKVSDMLTDLKYDLYSKESVNVVQGSGNHVLAVVGERIDSSVAVGPSTTRIYRISKV